MKIKITKEIPTGSENRPKVGGVYKVVRKEPGQNGLTLFIRVGGEKVGILRGEYENATKFQKKRSIWRK